MRSKLFVHLRRQWMGALALFLVLTGGAAYAANTVFSTDIVNGEVKTPDLATDAVVSGKIATGGVKTGDLAAASVNSDKVADDSLTGSDVNESSLQGLVRGSGFARGRPRALPPNSFGTVLGPLIGDPLPFNLFYDCPPTPSSQNGGLRFRNETGSSINLFADNGSTGPSFAGELAGGAEHVEAAAFGGEHIVLSAQYEDGRIAVISAFSRHRADDCHVQAQVVLTDPT